MALKECKACGKEVSKNATSCPHCGEPQGPKQYSLGGLIGLIFLGWLGYSFFTSDTLSSTTRSSSGASSASSSTPRATASPQLEVLSFNCEKEYGFVYVRGEVKNISSQKLENVLAVGAFRTQTGELVKSEDALLDFNPIMPNQTSPFEAGGTDNPLISSCGVSFKHLFGGAIPYKSSDK